MNKTDAPGKTIVFWVNTTKRLVNGFIFKCNMRCEGSLDTLSDDTGLLINTYLS